MHTRRRSGPARAAILLGVMIVALAGARPPAGGEGLADTLRRGIRAQSVFVRGRALYQARDYEGARARFVEALELEPNHDEARALLGWSQYFLAEYRAASITFKTGLQRQPAWEGLYAGLGWSRLRLGRYHLASEAFRTALDLNPDYVDAMIGLGSAQFEIGRYDAALPPLQTALRRLEPLAGPEPEEARVVRAKAAWTLYYLGRYPDAVALFEKAIRSAPDWHGLYNGAGWCYLKLGDRDKARVAFERALTLRPNYQDALEGLRQARV